MKNIYTTENIINCKNKGRFNVNKYDETVIKMIEGNLPAHWQMLVADRKGRTVAHEMARHDLLPADFSDWDLCDDKGWTVAHEAARYGNLPQDFSWCA